MEIIVLPYMAISFSIGWAIFSPFAQLEEILDLTFSKVETSDLFGLFLPISFLLAAATWTTTADVFEFWVVLVVTSGIVLFAFSSLLLGLFLFSKMSQPSPLRRMVVIGIIIPFGSLLSIAWFLLPLVAFSTSVFMAIPGTLMIVPATLGLRTLSWWACKKVDVEVLD